MALPMKHSVFLLAGFALLDASAAFGVEAVPVERASFVQQGITVYYDQRDEVFARKFAENIPQMVGEAKEALRTKRSDPAVRSIKDFKARRDEYLSVIAHYLGLKKPTTNMKRTFDVTLASVEKMTVATLADCERDGFIDVVQIWRKPDLLAALRANGPDDYFRLNKNKDDVLVKGISFSLGFEFDTADTGARGENRWVTTMTAPLRFGTVNRKKMFMPVLLAGTGSVDLEKEIPQLVAAARDSLDEKAGELVETMQIMLLQGVLHEVVEVAVIDHLIVSKDRRWFCEGMATFIAYRAVVELDTPEVARRSYDLRDQLDRWKEFETQVDLPGWKVIGDLNAEEQDSDFDSAHYAYATKAISNVYEKHGRKFFPRWCREIARTPWKKANIATVHAAFERLTGEKLSDYYPRPLSL